MRSALIVALDDEARLEAALASGADALVIDLARGLPETQLRAARRLAATALRAAAARRPGPRMLVRINPLETATAEEDLDAVMPAEPAGILLPGSLGGASVQRLGVKLAIREARFGLADGATRIIATATDTAQALFGLESYRGCSGRLAGLVWSDAGLTRDLGAEPGAGPLRLARDWTLLGAIAAGVTPIDGPFRDAADRDGLRAEAIAARRDGFRAKLAVDAAQVAIINEIFGAAAPAEAPAPEQPSIG